eukprot:Rhum_TRINITY_DN8372_c0_g1::Rhum_TRINITY_DN8372_c0_g1_i1::g.27598::m.27598
MYLFFFEIKQSKLTDQESGEATDGASRGLVSGFASCGASGGRLPSASCNDVVTTDETVLRASSLKLTWSSDNAENCRPALACASCERGWGELLHKEPPDDDIKLAFGFENRVSIGFVVVAGGVSRWAACWTSVGEAFRSGKLKGGRLTDDGTGELQLVVSVCAEHVFARVPPSLGRLGTRLPANRTGEVEAVTAVGTFTGATGCGLARGVFSANGSSAGGSNCPRRSFSKSRPLKNSRALICFGLRSRFSGSLRSSASTNSRVAGASPSSKRTACRMRMSAYTACGSAAANGVTPFRSSYVTMPVAHQSTACVYACTSGGNISGARYSGVPHSEADTSPLLTAATPMSVSTALPRPTLSSTMFDGFRSR